MQRIAKSLVAALLLLGVAVPNAFAAFGVQSFTADVLDASDQVVTQAGPTPYTGVTACKFNQSILGNPDGMVKDIRVNLPAGLISTPEATPKCSESAFPSCPPETQIGTETLTTEPALVPVTVTVPVYNMPPEAGQVSKFSFNVPVVGRTDIIGGVRDTSDYGLFFTISDVPTTASLVESKLTFFGDPAAQNGGARVDHPVHSLPPPVRGAR